ncbi:MAG: hypothetical protein AB7T49_08425 [Oligoflexales bacterium]
MGKTIYVFFASAMLLATNLATGQTADQPAGQTTGQTYTGPMGRKPSRPYLGFHVNFGEARTAGDSKAGLGWLIGVEPGYKVPRTAWDLIDASVELGTGHAQFERNNVDINLPIHLYLLAKAGYGYAIGEDVFGIVQLGAGTAFAKYTPEKDSEVDASTLSGFIGRLGFQVLAPVADGFDVFGALQLNYMSFSGSDVDAFQLNMPALSVGGRILF